MGEGESEATFDLDAFVEQVIDEVRRPLVGRGPPTWHCHGKKKNRRKNKAARASRRRNRK
jgi:hypothetical protein